MVYEEARSRRWTPKTRTGCRTCRTRRIKCDEARPQCNKCVRSARRCEGYEVAPRTQDKMTASVLLPRASTKYGNTLLYAPLRHSPPGLDVQELQALDFFRCHAANSLSGHFSSSVFQHLVLQIGEKQPVVLQASIAVGSIYRARLMATQMSFATIHDCPFYHLAVKQYNKSMSSLSQYIGRSGERDHAERLIVVLITCLLFVCFEMLHGDQAIVLSHLVKGLKILYERTRIRDSACKSKRILTIGNSDQDTFDTISQVFVRLDADSTMFGRRAPYLCPRSFGRFLGSELDLPVAFASLEEARSHLDTLTSITFGFRGELLKLVEQDVATIDPGLIDWPRHYCMLHAAVRRLDLDTNGELAMKKSKLLAAFSSWSDALDRLDIGGRRKALLMLRIQKFYPWFIIATLQDTRACFVDRFQDTFKRLLDMVTEYVDLTFHQCPEFAFALEPGITASVYLVGIQCRDRSIRERAIEILGKSSVQEGLWSRKQFASYCQRFMNLEEQRAKEVLGLECPARYIPEQARFTDVVFGMDSLSPGTGRLICARNNVELVGGLEVFEDRFEIDM